MVLQNSPGWAEECLRRALSEQPTSARAPRGLDRNLKTVLSNPVSHTFLCVGFQAWFAYFLATKKYEGFTDCVVELSVSELERIASEIQQIELDGRVHAQIEALLHTANRGRARLSKNTLSAGVGAGG